MIQYLVVFCLVLVAPLAATVVDNDAKIITLTEVREWRVLYADDVRDAMQQVPDGSYVMFYAGLGYEAIVYRGENGFIDVEFLDGCFGVGPEQQKVVDFILATYVQYDVAFPVMQQSAVAKECVFSSLEEWLQLPIDSSVMSFTATGTEWSVPSILAFGTYDKVEGLKEEDRWKVQKHGLSEKANYLSNYHVSPITVDGNHYPSVEHYYQAMKFAVGSLVYEQIVAASTANGARAIATVNASLADLGDDEEMSKRMKKALWHKFVNMDGTPSEYGKQLMQTKQQLLVEGNKRKGGSDRRWGAEFDFDNMPNSVSLEGQNLLGKLLMQLRAYLQP